MNDYKATVLQLLADIGSADPPAGPVISTSQFHAEVLRLLGEIASGGGGGGGGGSVITVHDENGTLDMKASELLAACYAGLVFVETDHNRSLIVDAATLTDSEYGTYGFAIDTEAWGVLCYYAATGDDYPSQL